MYASRVSVALGFGLLFCALSAFSQSGRVFTDYANQGETIPRVREKHNQVQPTGTPSEVVDEYPATPAPSNGTLDASQPWLESDASLDEPGTSRGDMRAEDSTSSAPYERAQPAKPSKAADFNRDVYYRNKLEFSLEGGWLPINVPFPLDIFVGDVYNTYPLKYTLVPIIASLRWQMNSVGGPWILRGNWDLTLSGSVTAIPRGPETRYIAYMMGIRRNFVPRNWRVAPYFEIPLGVGNIDAKGPSGVPYAQGEDLTFTMNMASGVRYNFSPRFAISAGMHFMHISNLDLSEGNGKPNWGFRNYGINVYGPAVGIDIQLRRHPRRSE